MASPEYLANRSAASGAAVSAVPAPDRRAAFGSMAVSSAIMALNDFFMIVLAFAFALLTRTVLVSHFAPSLAVHSGFLSRPEEVVYLGWFILAYILVARRYGLYAPAPSQTEATRSGSSFRAV